ncbi:DUF262 domain-containing HNH endonuclease family protein [Fusobacterium nucleatum]|uniref:DUF262 domain-containing protein n=1 Tax=Fusobacterium nucleatum subsp. polymorphum TaxID=76857 RepID=A0A2C6AX92_FUSNP|nr:DUF262 domain-containing protein [Fusobacterium polymorphum]PHH96662.1 hypothetical protein CA840_04585 [Fusobacterium polymorphum]
MSFQTPITIKGALDKIQENKYLLPAIQREFVWKSWQIEKLFDSLINDYPIGSFLFWEVKEPKNYKFYEFIKKYHQKETNHNQEICLTDDKEVIAVLDGQQRLTALYIGLLGTYTEKLPYYCWDNSKAFPDKYLCINLLDKIEEEVDDINKYEFKFCTKKEIEKKDNKIFWFKVGNILNLKSSFEITKKTMEILEGYSDDIIENASNKLSKLHNIVFNRPIINYYLEEENNLDKVLNIFLRVNSMGTKLNYSDLLLSIATAQWKDRDARKEINELVDELNKIGDGFNLDKDFVLRASLYLTKGIKNIRFKVDNFKKENMDLIEKNWDNIANSLNVTLNLLKSFGYNKDNLSANTPILPIALYILENNIDYKIINHSSFCEDRKLIKEWIIKSTLKRIFTGSENIAKIVRDIVLESGVNVFPLKEIKEKLKTIPGRNINFNEDEIKGLLDYGYYDEGAFSILQLLYPNLDYRNKFHIDHIYPKSKFNQKYLKKQGIDIKDLYDSNYLANLQLLDGNQNLEKSNKEFKDWLEENFSEEEKIEYFKRNYIPSNIDFTFENYNNFLLARDELLLKQLKKILLEKE